jgi:hypothetical protein
MTARCLRPPDRHPVHEELPIHARDGVARHAGDDLDEGDARRIGTATRPAEGDDSAPAAAAHPCGSGRISAAGWATHSGQRHSAPGTERQPRSAAGRRGTSGADGGSSGAGRLRDRSARTG